MSRPILTSMLAALAACGASAPGPQVTGSVEGFTYAMGHALVLNNVADDGSSSTTLVLTSDPELCGKGNVGGSLGYDQLAIVDLGIVTPSGVVVAPQEQGTFEVEPAQVGPGTKLADGEAISLLSSSCSTDTVHQALGGSVTVTGFALDAGLFDRVVGTVSLDFADGGTLAGTFDATYCDSSFGLFYDPCRR